MSPVTLSASASASPAPSRITNDHKSQPLNSDPTIITPTLPSTDSNNPPPPDDELTFLALHYLQSQIPHNSTHNSSDDNSINYAFQTLGTQLSTAGRLPTALDGYGSSTTLTFSQLVQRYKHIPSTFLKDLLQQNVPLRPLQVSSLLANGRFAPPTPRRPRPRRRNLSVVKKRETSSSSNIIALIHHLVTRIESPSINALTYVLLPKSFRHLRRLIGHHLTIFTTLFDCRGEFAVTGSDDHLIKIWSMQTGFLQHTLRGHDSDIIEIVRHPTHPIIVSASSDSTLRVWNVNTGAALYVLDGGSREVNTVTFSPCPDRPYLVSGGADGSVRLWNADNFEAGHIRIPIPGCDRPSNFGTDTGRTGGTLAATSNAVPSSPVNDHTNNRGTQSTTRATGVGSATTIPSNFVQQGHSTPIGPNTEIVTNPQQSQQLSSQTQQQPMSEGIPALPSPTSSDIPGRAANSVVSGTPSYEVLSVVFNAGATRLAVSGSDCMAYVYAIEKDESNDSALPTVRLLTALRGHSDNIIQVLFSRSGDSLITAGKDGIARIWKRIAAKLPDPKHRGSYVSGMGSWTSTVLDCRGRMQADAPSMLSGGATGSAAGSVVPRLRRQYFPVRLCAAMWSLNDDYVITSSSDTKIRVWNARTGRLLRTLDEHRMEVYAMDCHPTNGRILLSAGYDGKCILWDIDSGRMLRKMSIPCENGEIPNDDFPFPSSGPSPQISDGQFSSDGLSFIVADTSGAINVFGTGSGEEIALAPTEQFFSNDCAPYRRDEQRRAIDENTRQLLHLVPRGRLCNKEFRPYPPELQPQYPEVIPAKTDRNETGADESNNPDFQAQRGSHVGVAASVSHDKRREALLLRAKEFRENQEKEERRLVREAREARRRMIMERRKADLKKDIEPSYLEIRNFAVSDSDYEESDKDFDGENESSHSESSSASSGEEDEITPARGRPLHRSNLGDRRDRQSRNTRRRSTRHNPRSKHVTDSHSDSMDSDIEGNDDSPDYEVDTLDSDTDNSSSSGAQIPRGSVDEEDNKQSKHRERSRKSRRERKAHNKLDRNQRDPDLIENPVALSNRNRTIVRLEGSVIRHGAHRMRIRVNRSNATVNNSSAPSVDARQSQWNDNATFSEANEGGKDIIRNHFDANGAGPSQPLSTTPLNPSFTSERQNDTRIPTDNNTDVADARKTSATLTAPEQSKSVDAEGNHANNSNEITPHSLDDKKIGRRHRRQSPAQKTRKKWKTRSRSRNRNQTDQMADAASPTIDIDELAELEMEILDEKPIRKKSKKRKRRSRHDDNEDEDQNSDGSHRKRNRQDGEDSSTRHGRTHRRRSSRRTEGTDANQKQHQETVHETKPLEGSAWLRTCRNAYTYVPQHGDDVMYFQQGHLAALEEAKSEGLELTVDDSTLRDTKGRVLDGKTLGRDAGPLRLQIVNITFHFTCAGGESRSRHGNARSKSRKGIKEKTTKQTKTFLTLTLKPVHVTTQQQALFDTYLLTYYPVDAPEYLVLTSRVEAALNRAWRIGDRVRILFLNEQREWQYYTGTIRTVSPTIRTVIWNTVEVEYDNEEEKGKAHLENVSPWELEAQEGQLGSRDNQQSQLPKTSFEPGLFPMLARELEACRNMDPSWRTNPPWLDSADSLASSPGYCKAVPCPLDLNTVIVRVCTGYYRQFSSFLHDLLLMKGNSLRIHGAQSEQGRQAIHFFTRLTESCERVRIQFLSQYTPILPAIATQYGPPASVTAPSTARAIRPRPSPADVSGQTALTPSNFGVPNTGRPFLPSMNNRMGNIGFATPIFPTSENGGSQHIASSSHVRTWNGQRGYQPGVQTHTQTGFTNSHPGIGLPPAVPVQSATAQRSGVRSNRLHTRTQGSRQHSNGHTRATNLTIPPVIHQGSNIATTSTSMPAPMAPHMIPSQVIMTTPIIGGSTIQQNSVPSTRIPEVASSQIHNNQSRGPSSSAQRPTATQAFSHSRMPVRSSSQAVTMPPLGSRPSGSDNGTIPIVKHYQMVGTQSPLFDNGQMTAPLPPMPVQQRHAPRSASVDGGTHSWGRSMEGAGGVPAMHAATSESHAPRSGNHGQSQSPISPSGARLESLNSLVRHQGISGLLSPAAPADHEHSVISNAAAESTMSCGGADVALQAGTAESEEVGTQRNSRRRR